MSITRQTLLVICLLSLVGSLFAGGFALSGVGTRALSMGGAYRGLANDGTAMYWNPAGLTQASGMNFILSSAVIIPSADYTSSVPWPGIENNKKFEAEDKIWAFPNLYFNAKASEKLAYGFAVYVPFGLGAEWDIFKTPTVIPYDINGDGTPENVPITWENGFPEKEYLSSISIIDMHPSIAYQVTEKLSAGAGLSMFYGNIEIKKLIPHKTATTSYFTYLPKILDLEGSGFGFGANMGLMYKMNDKLQFGLTGKLPGSLTLKGDASIDLYLNSFIAQSPTFAPLNVVQDTILHMPADAEATVNLPAELGFGLAYNLNENWLVTADVSWTGWSCMDKIEIELDGTDFMGQELPDVELNTKWEDTVRLSLGTEYKLSCGSALRAGFFFDPSPIPDEALDPTWPDVNNKFSYNLGFAYPINEKISVDFAYEYIHFTEREISTQVYSSTSGSPENMTGKYNTAINALNLGLNYKF